MGIAWVAAVVGSAFGLWTSWWDSTGDFRLPVLMIAAASSVTGGVVAAFAYERLSERREQIRWKYVAHVGASSLRGRALSAAQAIANVLATAGEEPVVVETLDDVRAVEAGFRKHQDELLLNPHVAQQLGALADFAWALVRSTPRLRDDPVLVRETLQAANSLPAWGTWLSRYLEMGAPQLSARQLQNLAAFREVAWQTIRVCVEHGELHLDQELEERTLKHYREAQRQAEAAVAALAQDNSHDAESS